MAELAATVTEDVAAQVDIEQRVLGLLLAGKPGARDAISMVMAEALHFQTPHDRIAAAIDQQIGRGLDTRAADIAVMMASDPGLAELKGREYLGGLADASPAVISPADGTAQIERAIRTHAALRQRAAMIRDLDDAKEAIARGEPDALAKVAALATEAARAEPSIETIAAASLQGRPLEPRAMFLEGAIRKATPSILGGDGGTGKSTIALQLVGCTQTEATFFGRVVETGPAIYLSAEDDIDELHRRLADVAESQDATLADMKHLQLVALAGKDAILAVQTPNGSIAPTPLYHAVERLIRDSRPVLVVLDNLADVFGGDENNRVHARRFIGLLHNWCVCYGTTVILLAHPSLSGLSSGSGSSGSTAWNNSVRSRLTLERVKSAGDTENDPDLRILKMKKANYGPISSDIRLRWDRGVFRLASETGSSAATAAAEAKAEEDFLAMLDAYAVQGRHVSATPSANFAPTIFAADKSCAATRRALTDAMNRLLASGKIVVDEFGPASKRRRRVIRVSL